MSASNASSRNLIPMSNKYHRIVLLVDMDCFYCQVEEKLDPSLKGQPVAVVQYNAWRGGGIIAVNYAARAKGVTRHMRGEEAKEQCPEIQLVKVPNVREKADLTKYREAGKDVANVLQRFTPLLERASVDEAYLDITEAVNKRMVAINDGTFILKPHELINTYAVGFSTIGDYVTTITKNYTNPLLDNDDFYRNFQECDIPAVRKSNIRLLIGASIASEIRAAVKAETDYDCSAGIAHNKILAKLTCGINKPNKQTLLPLAQIEGLFATLPVGKIKGLGAKFGEEICERMGIRYLGQLLKFTESELQRKFDEKNGTWLYYICRGIDLEAVTPRFYAKSIGCCKKFPGRNSITGLKTLQHWLNELANEISERLEKDIIENNRRAKQMVLNFIQEFNSEEISSSRSAPLNSYDTEVVAKICLEIIKTNTKQFFRSGSESVINNPIKFLGISVGKFETISNSQTKIQDMFAQLTAKEKRLSDDKKQTNPDKDTANKVDNLISINKNKDRLDKKVAIKDVTSQKKKHDIKSFFTNVLINQVNHNIADLCHDNELQTLNELDTLDKEAVIEIPEVNHNIADLCHDNEVQTLNELDTLDKEAVIEISHEPLQQENHQKLNELITPDNEAIVSKIASNYLFSIHIRKGDGNTPQASINIKDTECDNGLLYKSLVPKVLTNNVCVGESSALTSTVEEGIFQTNEKTQDDVNRNDNTELNDLINDLERMQNETDETIRCDDTLQLQTELISTSLNNKRKFDAISDESASEPKDDYRSEYAEFALPAFRPEFLQFTSCATCGAKILNDPMSIQTHRDHHFAQELSQQQRLEFRQELRTKINTAKSPHNNVNKKVKKVTATSKKPLQTGIEKFLKPSLLPKDLNETLLNNNTLEICHICKVPLKLEEVSEHRDFHMAKELQRKLNQLEVHTVDIVKKTISETSHRNLNSSLVAPPRQSKVTAKPITQFFTQSNN